MTTQFTRSARTIVHEGASLIRIERGSKCPPVLADALTDWIVRQLNAQNVNLETLYTEWMAKP